MTVRISAMIALAKTTDHFPTASDIILMTAGDLWRTKYTGKDHQNTARTATSNLNRLTETQMKIDWLEYDSKDHVLAWVLLEAMSKAGIERFGQFNSSDLEVELTVNGISVPIVEVMEFLQSQLDRLQKDAERAGREMMVREIQNKLPTLLGEE